MVISILLIKTCIFHLKQRQNYSFFFFIFCLVNKKSHLKNLPLFIKLFNQSKLDIFSGVSSQKLRGITKTTNPSSFLFVSSSSSQWHCSSSQAPQFHSPSSSRGRDPWPPPAAPPPWPHGSCPSCSSTSWTHLSAILSTKMSPIFSSSLPSDFLFSIPFYILCSCLIGLTCGFWIACYELIDEWMTRISIIALFIVERF